MDSQEKTVQRIDEETRKTASEILELQKQLDNERAIQKYKGEYEELAALINQYKTKEELQKSFSEESQTKQNIDADIIATANKIEMKKKQLNLLTSLLLELKQDIEIKPPMPVQPQENAAPPPEPEDMEEVIDI